MSIKTTRTITRNEAMTLLMAEIPMMSNDTLGDVLDVIADRGSMNLSRFDNFIVSNYVPSIYIQEEL